MSETMTPAAKTANPKTHKLVRISPASPRRVHVFQGYHFKQSDGWYAIPNPVAEACREEPLHEGSPATSPRIFEVKSVDEARATVEAERAQIEPPGTVDRPKMIEPGRSVATVAPISPDAPAAEDLRQAARALSEREREVVTAERDLEDQRDDLARKASELAAREEALKVAEAKAAEKPADPPPTSPKGKDAAAGDGSKVTTGPAPEKKK